MDASRAVDTDDLAMSVARTFVGKEMVMFGAISWYINCSRDT